jgi:group I intron endonuclease
MTYAVYHIHREPSLNSGYVGITMSIQQRWSQHGWKRKGSNKHLQSALKKYGNEIKYSIVAEGLDFETAKWIESILRPFPNTGWNIAKGGGVPPSPKGKARSAEHCKNISKAKLGEKNPMFGKKVVFSEDHRKKLSSSGKGRQQPHLKGKQRPKVTCHYCGKEGAVGAMHRWHFERCKHYEA